MKAKLAPAKVYLKETIKTTAKSASAEFLQNLVV